MNIRVLVFKDDGTLQESVEIPFAGTTSWKHVLRNRFADSNEDKLLKALLGNRERLLYKLRAVAAFLAEGQTLLANPDYAGAVDFIRWFVDHLIPETRAEISEAELLSTEKLPARIWPGDL